MQNLNRRKLIIPENTCLIMGILNFTPDSFSENGEFFELEKALSHAKDMISQGADIIDLGLESTRPNAQKVTEEEELRRLKEILPSLRQECKNTLISIDTYKPAVAQYAMQAGADIINCVFGGAFDVSVEQVEMYKTVVKYDCPIIITHNKPISCVEDVLRDLEAMANLAIENGVKKENIILDYGFGFNKTLAQNLDMQREIKSFESLGYPLLVALSRKSTLKAITSEAREDLDDATLVFLAHSICNANIGIFRTHNVGKTKICIDCLKAIRG